MQNIALKKEEYNCPHRLTGSKLTVLTQKRDVVITDSFPETSALQQPKKRQIISELFRKGIETDIQNTIIEENKLMIYLHLKNAYISGYHIFKRKRTKTCSCNGSEEQNYF